MRANGQSNGKDGAPDLGRDSADSLPVAGLRQTKMPLSDDPFWDQE